jgi:NTE family protein
MSTSRRPKKLAPSRLLCAWVFCVLTSTAVLLPSHSWASDAPGVTPPALAAAVAAVPTPRPRVALVLSGGGARGLSHVGVLQVLEEAQVPVDLIVGTSMGAIVGGLYASGMTPAQLKQEILAVDWGGLFERREPRQLLSQRLKDEDVELSPVLELGFRDGEFRLPTGAVSTRSLEMLLRRYTLPARRLENFDQLPTPFRAVATDMETGQPVVMDRGDLAAVLRASMSVPGVFSPLAVGGRILGDGGLVNNLPVNVARSLGAEIVIAVNIGTPLAGRETLGSVLGITTQMVNILTEQNVQASIATLSTRDLLLQPPLGKLTSADFDRGADLVKIGEDYAQSVRSALTRFSTDGEGFARWQAERARQAQANASWSGPVAAIRIEGVKPQRAERLTQLIDTAPGRVLDVPTLETDLQRLAATGDYEQVDYRLVSERGSDSETLVIRLRENSWGPNYLRAGIDLNTDFQGRGEFNLRVSHNRHWLNDQGAEWRNRVQLGTAPGLSSEIYQPLGADGGRFVSGYAAARLRRIEAFNEQGDSLAIGRRQSLELGADIGWPIGLQGRLGEMRMGLLGGAYRTVPEIVSAALDPQQQTISTLSWQDIGLRAAVVSDQLDFANFPSQGYRLKADLSAGQRRSGGDTRSFVRLEGSANHVSSWGVHTLNTALRFAHASQIPPGAIDEYSLGGFQQLSGYRTGQVAGNYLLFGRVTYYQRLPYELGFVRGLFAGGSLEAGNAWLDRSSISLGDLRAGASLFVGADTGFGPLYLSIVSAPRGYTGLYLFLGRP